MNQSVQPVHSEAELPAREMLPTPEAASLTEEERAPVRQPEAIMPAPLPPGKPPVQGAQLAPHAAPKKDLFVEKSVREAAEKNLADFIADKITPHVLDDTLRLSLKEEAKDAHTGLKLCLSGAKLEGNHALVGHQIVEALKHHPVFAPYFAHEQTKPHFREDKDNPTMVHVHIDHLSPSQYHDLFTALASESLVAPVVPGAGSKESHGDVVSQKPPLPGSIPQEPNAAGLTPATTVSNVNDNQKLAERAAGMAV